MKTCLRCEWAETDCGCEGGPLFVSVTAAALIKTVQRNRHRLNQYERMLLLAAAREGICEHCGIDNPRCQCWNDE